MSLGCGVPGQDDRPIQGKVAYFVPPCYECNSQVASSDDVDRLISGYRPLVRPHYTGTLTTVAFPPFFPIVCCNPMRDCGVVDVRRFDLPKRKRPSMILAVLRHNPFIT